jgi:hypothetical protein
VVGLWSGVLDAGNLVSAAERIPTSAFVSGASRFRTACRSSCPSRRRVPARGAHGHPTVVNKDRETGAFLIGKTGQKPAIRRPDDGVRWKLTNAPMEGAADVALRGHAHPPDLQRMSELGRTDGVGEVDVKSESTLAA